jgi:hypothetical protein
MITEAPTLIAKAGVGTQTVLVVEDEDGLRELAKPVTRVPRVIGKSPVQSVFTS